MNSQNVVRPASATVLFSGGIDSLVVVHFLASQERSVKTLFIDYGQAAAKQEHRAAKALANKVNVPLTTITLNERPTFRTGELLGRNAFLLLTAVFLGNCHEGLLALGVHAGTTYYDCSADFTRQMHALLAAHTDGRLQLVTPLQDWSKERIVTYARQERLPLQLTYSCEAGSHVPCGQCSSCKDRIILQC